jgi:hypothetical protein
MTAFLTKFKLISAVSKEYVFEIQPSDTVGLVKQNLGRIFGATAHNIELISGSLILKDDTQPLRQLIPNNSVVFVHVLTADLALPAPDPRRPTRTLSNPEPQPVLPALIAPPKTARVTRPRGGGSQPPNTTVFPNGVSNVMSDQAWFTEMSGGILPRAYTSPNTIAGISYPTPVTLPAPTSKSQNSSPTSLMVSPRTLTAPNAMSVPPSPTVHLVPPPVSRTNHRRRGPRPMSVASNVTLSLPSSPPPHDSSDDSSSSEERPRAKSPPPRISQPPTYNTNPGTSHRTPRGGLVLSAPESDRIAGLALEDNSGPPSPKTARLRQMTLPANLKSALPAPTLGFGDKLAFNQPSPAHCTCDGFDPLNNVHALGTDRVLTVNIRNDLGLPLLDALTPRGTAGGLVQIVIRGPDHVMYDVPAQSSGTGQYRAKYRTQGRAGVYDINVLVNGQHVSGSPFMELWEVGTSQGTDPSACKVTGLALIGGVAGRDCVFFLQARDSTGNDRTSGGDPFKAILFMKNQSGAAARITDFNNGTYMISYNATRAGSYQLVLSLNNQHVAGSPFQVNIEPAVACGKTSECSGPGTRSVLTNSGIPSEFFVVARDQFQNRITRGGDRIRLKLDNAQAQLLSKVTDNRDGTYLVQYFVNSPFTSVTRVKLVVAINNEAIGLPLAIDVIPPVVKPAPGPNNTVPNLNVTAVKPAAPPRVTPRLPENRVIVRIQSAVRTALARSLFAQLQKTYRLRTKAASELVTSEESYIQYLLKLKEEYLNPLRMAAQRGKPVISLAKIALIFSNIEFIISINTEFLNKMRPRLTQWSATQLVADLVIEVVPSLKYTYTQYVNNYDQALKTLNWCIQKEDAFNHFLSERDMVSTAGRGNAQHKGPQSAGLSLPAYLIMPVQRLPKYELLLSELLRHTAEEHPDRANIELALQQIRETTLFVNENKRNAENLSRLLSLQNQISDCMNLFSPDRVFIREENLKVHNTVETKEKIRRVFLFNDMLLIARHKKSRRALFKFKEAVEFKSVQRIEQQGKPRARVVDTCHSLTREQMRRRSEWSCRRSPCSP